MIALRQWGEKYTTNVPSNLVLVDARDRKPIELVRLHAHDGRPLDYADLDWEEAGNAGQQGSGKAGECC